MTTRSTRPLEHGSPAISVSSTASRPIADGNRRTRNTHSVKTRAYLGAALIIVLFLTISAINLGLAKFYYQPRDDHGLASPLQTKAQLIESRLSYLRGLLEHIARQPTTQDLLALGDSADAQRWALQILRFLPQASGAALLDGNGNILGEPISQPPDPLCLADLGRLSQGQRIKSPAVHQSHFDLTSPVFDETDNRLGLLFVSFGLDELQALLREHSRDGQQFVLRDGHGNIITQWGSLAGDTDTHSASLPIRHSDWRLQLSEAVPAGASPGFLSLVIFNASAFLLIVASLTLLVRRHSRRVEGDFQQVRSHIEQLASGRADARPPTPRLREAARILPALDDIRHNLGAQQQQLARQSRTDPLTGLANHRQFNIEFTRAHAFARRDTPVGVVRIQLQGLDAQPQETARHTLKLLARTLRQVCRRVDFAARLGDDQFALLLYGSKRHGVEACLQRLRDDFQEQQRQRPDIADDRACTLRCGYTLIHRHRDNDAGQILARAEQALRDADDEQPVIGKQTARLKTA